MIDLKPLTYFAGTTRSGVAIRLRPMRAGDELVFRELYAEMRAAELAALPWPDSAKRQFCDSQFAAQDAHYRAHYAQFIPLAVCSAGAGNEVEEVIGRLYLGEFDDAFMLMDIIVASRMRGRGIGAMLVEAVTQHADLCGVEVRLHVEPNNRVRKHYARLGFIEVGEPGIYQQMVRTPAKTG